MVTAKEACKRLGITQKQLDQHLAVAPSRGYHFVTKNGENILHDADVELIALRMDYQKRLETERQNTPSIDQ